MQNRCSMRIVSLDDDDDDNQEDIGNERVGYDVPRQE